jgi:hypothetical protein
MNKPTTGYDNPYIEKKKIKETLFTNNDWFQ